jgi:16S rRNA (uracil1498-N3)-methyltransferase
MKNPRLYVPEPLRPQTELVLPAEAANHLRVLRLQVGNPLTIFNGEGGEFTAEVVALERREARVRLLEHRAHEAESPLALTLIQGISKGERMDFTIQKAVELGVSRIAPVFTARSIVQLNGDRLGKREAHWRGIIQSACEQCGRNRLPELMPTVALDQAWQRFNGGIRLVLNPGGGVRLQELPLGEQRMALLVGPEGGLTEAEVASAEGCGFQGLRLGPRVLRTETAGLAALAALQALAGDLG